MSAVPMNAPSGMNAPASLAPSDLLLSNAAATKLAEIMSDADPEFPVIRLFVAGGGCSGMGYGMTFSEGVMEYDSVLEGNGFTLAVDAVALNYLRGVQIDFTGEAFVFNGAFSATGGSGGCGAGGCGGGGGGCGSGGCG